MLWEKSNIYLVALVVMILIEFVLPYESHAVPAAPVIHTLKQPDGSTFQARQWGDEWLHGWETVDGFSIILNEGLNSWTYAIHSADGSLISSLRIVGIDHPDVPKHIRPEGQTLLESPLKMLTKEFATIEEAPRYIVPPTGTGNIPVILINFNDTTTTFEKGNFNTLLFGAGNYSMKDYFEEVSYGVFSISSGPSGVVGWFTALNTHNYYGTDISNQGDDAWPGDLVREAVAAADAAGFNFAPYDQDGDCYVDVVNIIHQGSGQEASGVTTDIWSHRWSLNGALYWGRSHFGQYTSDDPCPSGGYIKVNDYVIQPETTLGGGVQTIGVFAHEYGHALGLPDLYDTDYTSRGIGKWSLMAGGSWNYITTSGDRPAHMDAWCKYKLGWITPKQVVGTLPDVAIEQADTIADVYQLLNGNPSSGGEYFLIENRQKDKFDEGLPGVGLLIWHIDESRASNTAECYPGGPSCASNHYKVALVQADNLWEMEKYIDSGDTGDPYPGSTNNTSFTASSSPNSNLYNGNPSNVSITNIRASDSMIISTMSISDDAPSLQLSSDTYSVNENGGNAIITITRAGGSNGSVGVTLSNSNGSATAGADYTATTQTVSFGNGDTANKTVSIPILDDSTYEGNETVNLTLSNPTGGATLGNPTTAVLTIVDDEQPPPVRLLSPNGGEVIASGSIYHIEWEPAEAVKFNLMYSKDNGSEWYMITSITSTPVTVTSFDWIVPKPWGNKKTCLVKVKGYDASGYKVGADKSDAPFIIEVVKLTSPNGGVVYTSGDPLTITWTTNATREPVSKVRLYYTKDGGITWYPICNPFTGKCALPGNPGSYDWKVPTVGKAKSYCKVKVELKDENGNILGKDASDGWFTIQPIP